MEWSRSAQSRRGCQDIGPRQCGPLLLQSITISGIPETVLSLPASQALGNSIRGEVEEGAGVSSQEHSIPAAQTSGDPSQIQRPKGTSAYSRNSHPFQGGSQWSPVL